MIRSTSAIVTSGLATATVLTISHLSLETQSNFPFSSLSKVSDD